MNNDSDAGQPTQSVPGKDIRKPWHAPRLSMVGSIAETTQSGALVVNDASSFLDPS